ncbi:hypothetical protein [Nitrosomonas communis]|uniref:Uncharacterized protein n=1 Tax=Nitrosomonas communis TaxID=44574 RepID=A0A1I4V375_9PROT|nr:hypothetical protein [Nitrosomonas communis]SFM95571.1 hypothetical protein SAMN05421863_107511 [Nitrosomonas communis]
MSKKTETKKIETKKIEIKWISKPEGHHYNAALSYLRLIYDEKIAASYVSNLEKAMLSEFQAKDIFRASTLPLLDISNIHVKRDIQKIQLGEKLSPLLLVRDSNNGKVIIADGYHRLCAIYSYDEDVIIPCMIV